MTVNALLAKALSTNSDEEAMAAFRMARKKNNGATLNLNMASNTESDKWKAKAQEYYNLAKRLRGERNKNEEAAKFYLNQAQKYYGYMNTLDAEITNLKKKVRDLEKSGKRLSAAMWQAGFFIQLGLMTVPAILFGVFG